MKPLPLLVAVCALAGPAAATSVTPAPTESKPTAAPAFDASDLLVVDWSQFGPGPAANGIQQTCASGTVAALKDQVISISNDVSTRVGYNEPIPLYCAYGGANGQGGSLVPIPAATLNLTVYFPHVFSVAVPYQNGADYKLNRGPQSASITLRDVKSGDIKPVKPPTPPPHPPPQPPPHPDAHAGRRHQRLGIVHADRAERRHARPRPAQASLSQRHAGGEGR
jgi:hypothetical protein